MKNPALISKIKSLDALTADEKAELIALLNNTKKYGLVWEDKPEDVEEQLRHNLPVLREVTEKRIIGADIETKPVAVNPELFENENSTPEPGNTPNHVLIEGDNLHALTALSFTHENKIDVIYIDPPYNTGNKDFKYNDSFVDKEDSYRHSKWLSFMNKRLQIAKRLLSDKGVIFISIDDNEIAQLKLMCDEIFGEQNFISQSTLVNNIAGRSDKKHIALAHEYVLIYQKTENFISTGVDLGENLLNEYKFKDEKGIFRTQGLRKRGANSRREDRPNLYYSIFFNPLTKQLQLDKEEGYIEIVPKLSDGADGNWRWGKSTFLEKKHYLITKMSNKKYEIFEKVYLENNGESKTTKMKSFLFDSDYTTDTATTVFKSVLDNVQFNNPKSTFLLQDLIKISTKNKNEVILDFFAGSGTTLHATLQINDKDNGNRQCILVTNNENNIAEEVCYERNKRVIEGYTNSKGQWVEGLPNNNFRYYKTEFVGSAKTEANRRKLTRLSTALLQIKEDCYHNLTASAGFDTESCHISANGSGRYLVVIYHNRRRPELIEQLREWIKTLPVTDEKIRMYAFSEEQEVLLDEFYDVAGRIMAVPLPDAIYNAYRATFRTLGFDRKEPQQNGNPAGEALATDEMPELDFNQTEE